MLADVTIHSLDIVRCEALGTLLGMVDAMLLFHDNNLENMLEAGWPRLHEARAAYDEAAKACREARVAESNL